MSLVAVSRHGPVAVLTLHDPGRRNVLSAAMCARLSAAVAAAEADASVKAVVVTGADPAFCAGADLADLKAASAGDTAAVEAVYRSFIDVANCSLPTIAAVNGPAVGAGLNLALACDVRVAGEGATFDTRFLQIGLHPGGGHGWLLLRAVGWAEASRLLLLGQAVDAGRAAAIGLAQQVAPAGELLPAALALADGLGAVPRDLLVETKASLRLAARSSHADMFRHETAAQMHSLGQPAFQELVGRLQGRLGRR